jgi:hypothetical protein
MHGLIEIIAMNEEAQRFWEDGVEQPPTMLLKNIDYGSERLRRAYEKSQLITTRTSREENHGE